MLDTLNMWSDTDQALVNWSVEKTQETDEGGNVHDLIMARYGDEIKRYSPNMTDQELLDFATATNQQAGV